MQTIERTRKGKNTRREKGAACALATALAVKKSFYHMGQLHPIRSTLMDR